MLSDSKPSEHGESSVKEVPRKSSSEWENVSWDSAKWNLLIGRLEDVALLDLILGQNPSELCNGSEKTEFPCLQYEKPNISFSSLLQKGKGKCLFISLIGCILSIFILLIFFTNYFRFCIRKCCEMAGNLRH